ncbi:MAG: PTS glucose transporter subunit IIA, partial [Megasphaera micronuciformis]|nr:PTS glucose transporter subunit IIA [Megasphaera micronuciformis]
MTSTDFSSLTIYSPFTGELHPIDDTPDEVFSSKVTGDGFCVFPSKGEVTAPTSGTIT